MVNIELKRAHHLLQINGVGLSATCPKCAAQVARVVTDWLEPTVDEPFQLTLLCSCGYEWEISVKFTVGATIIDAQPSLLDELDAAAAAFGRSRTSDEIWILCDLSVARQRGLWHLLVSDEYIQRVPLNMPFEIDDSAGHSPRTLTLPNGTTVEVKLHIVVFAIAPNKVNAGV